MSVRFDSGSPSHWPLIIGHAIGQSFPLSKILKRLTCNWGIIAFCRYVLRVMCGELYSISCLYKANYYCPLYVNTIIRRIDCDWICLFCSTVNGGRAAETIDRCTEIKSKFKWEIVFFSASFQRWHHNTTTRGSGVNGKPVAEAIPSVTCVWFESQCNDWTISDANQ